MTSPTSRATLELRFWHRSVEEKLRSQWAIGGRIGWLVTPQLLTYFSGGYTEAKFN